MVMEAAELELDVRLASHRCSASSSGVQDALPGLTRPRLLCDNQHKTELRSPPTGQQATPSCPRLSVPVLLSRQASVKVGRCCFRTLSMTGADHLEKAHRSQP